MKPATLLVLLTAFAPGVWNGLYAKDLSRGVPVQVVITAEGHKGQDPPEISSGDVTAHIGKAMARVDDLIPLRGDRAGLQLAIFIDDGSASVLSLQFDELKKFIRDQPPTTQVGIYYIRNGSAVTMQALTADHEAAASHFRLPAAEPGIAVSPSDAISEFIKKWPGSDDRREILLISDGVDLYRGYPTQNPYLAAAISTARRAKVQVHSIYFPGAGHAGHDYFLLNYGRDYLSILGDGTGGESYWQGIGSTVSIKPYLDDLSARLKHQYLLTFTAPAESKGRFEHVRLTTETPNIDLTTADQAWVPAAK